MAPLEKRPFRIKNSRFHFLCPLCASERSLRYSPFLSSSLKFKLAVISLFLFFLTFPLLQERGFILPFLVFSLGFLINRALYKKEIPCPYCGFNALTYKKDVIKAKEEVKVFWQQEQNFNKTSNFVLEEERPLGN